jgi:hypothetical protein
MDVMETLAAAVSIRSDILCLVPTLCPALKPVPIFPICKKKQSNATRSGSSSRCWRSRKLLPSFDCTLLAAAGHRGDFVGTKAPTTFAAVTAARITLMRR